MKWFFLILMFLNSTSALALEFAVADGVYSDNGVLGRRFRHDHELCRCWYRPDP